MLIAFIIFLGVAAFANIAALFILFQVEGELMTFVHLRSTLIKPARYLIFAAACGALFACITLVLWQILHCDGAICQLV